MNPHQVDLSGVAAIYFDLDDTLCGYWDACKAGLAIAFAEHGPTGFSPKEMVCHWAAAFREFCPNLKSNGWYERYLQKSELSRTEQMRLTLARVGIQDYELAVELSQSYMVARDANLRLFDDAAEFLAWVKPRYRIGLITNGPADAQRMELQTLGLTDTFEHVFIEGELGFGKPSQEVFRRAAAAFSVSGRELLFVGNSYQHDIRPAIDAGWRTAWVRRLSDVPPSADGVESSPEDLPPGAAEPNTTIADLRSLIPLLDR